MDFKDWANHYDSTNPSAFVKACDASRHRQLYTPRYVPQEKEKEKERESVSESKNTRIPLK